MNINFCWELWETKIALFLRYFAFLLFCENDILENIKRKYLDMGVSKNNQIKEIFILLLVFPSSKGYSKNINKVNEAEMREKTILKIL